jgi:flagellar hook-basal body complex protein FliE
MLSDLEVLNLNFNSISGTLSSSLGLLKNLIKVTESKRALALTNVVNPVEQQKINAEFKASSAELQRDIEKVEDTKIVLDRVSEALPPSSDEHEAVFIQHEKAKTDLREAVTTINKASIQNYLAHAHEASSEAYAVLKQL